MMVSFASKTKDIRSDLASASRSGDGPRWFRNVRDGKDLRVRFLQDPDEWLQFKEHYSQETKYFPCTQESNCPGCNSDNERMQYPSKKYIAQVFIVHEEGAKDVGKVVPLKLTRDLANRLITRCDRNGGTLLDRDFTLIRKGNDKDTSYDVEVEDRAPFSAAWEPIDVEAMLVNMFADVWGSEGAEAPKEVKTKVPAVEQTMKSKTPTQDKLLAKAAEDNAAAGDEPPF